MGFQPYYIVKINLALWRVLDMKVRESAVSHKWEPSAELRYARTNHVVSLNHIRQQKRLNRKNSI